MEGCVYLSQDSGLLRVVIMSKTKFTQSIRQAMHETSVTMRVREVRVSEWDSSTGKERDTCGPQPMQCVRQS